MMTIQKLHTPTAGGPYIRVVGHMSG